MDAKRKVSKEELGLKKQFYELMFELDLYNKFKKTYMLNILKETNYGYYAHIYLVSGLSFDMLQDRRKIIEQNLNCLWIMQIEPFKKYAEVQIVLKPVDEKVEFENPKIKPHEIYLGLSFSNKIQKSNNNDNCMFLLAGATGSGKTRFIYQILLSWILGCSPESVWLYLSDIAKNEYVQFRNVKHIKYYASELDELYEMMGLVLKEFNYRKKLISQYRENGVATNISEYNRISKSKLSYCYVLIDEFSVVIPDRTDSKDEKEQKEYILDVIKRISKLGRGLGMFIFIATQKTTREEIPSIIKNMSAVRISFRANDPISSEVIMSNNVATGLPDRVAVYSLNGGSSQKYLYAPRIETEKLNEILEPYIECKSTINKGNVNEGNSNSITCKSKTKRIPKGINAREYLKSLKNNNSNNKEDNYNDY